MNGAPHKIINCKNNFGTYEDVPIEKFIFRPSAYGFIVNNGEIVTLTNNGSGKIWPPGGGINLGEKMEDGLAREIFEETGLKVKVGKMVLVKENFFYYKPLDEAYHAFLFFYLCRPITTELISDNLVNDSESKRPRWTRISDINKDDLADFPDDILKILSGLNQTQQVGSET